MTYVLYDGATSTTAQAVLAKENVDDVISNLFPLDYPLQQWLERVPMGPTPYKEFPVDTFSGITRTSASVAMDADQAGNDTVVKYEGEDATDITDTYEHKIRAVAEIHHKSFKASGTVQAADFHGITDPYAYSAYKRTEEVASDFELRFWHGKGTTPAGAVVTDFASGASANGIRDGSGAAFPRQTQGIFNWIVRTGLERTTSGVGATFYNAHGEVLKSSAVGNYCSYAYDLNGQNMTRDNFRSKLMQPWQAIGGRPDGCVLFCGGQMKQLFSDFAQSVTGQVNQRNIPAESKTIVDTVDVYVTDYGTHYVNYSRYLDDDEVSLYNTTSAGSNISAAWNEAIIAIMPSYWKIGVFRGIGLAKLAKVGDADRGMVVGEMGLICRNPIAGAALINGLAG